MVRHWKRMHTAAVTVFTLAIVGANLVFPMQYRVWAWLLTTALLILFVSVAGHGITGLWRGALK